MYVLQGDPQTIASPGYPEYLEYEMSSLLEV